MSKLILTIVVGLASLVSAAAQASSGVVGGQPKALVRSDEIANPSRVRALSGSGAADKASDATAIRPSSLLNHATAKNAVPQPGLSSANVPATRPRTSITIAATTAALPLSPNQIYRVGVGDVLDVKVLDVPTAKSTLYTVLEGGLLDYPLSNAPLAVAGMTADEIAAQLTVRIKVLDNPRVAVRVRDYSSHSVIVSGFVLDPGARFLRRETTPLYVVLAEARPRSEAIRATITRAGGPAINIDLKNQNSLATPVLPGDIIKVLTPAAEPSSFYYTGGALNTPGQKPFHSGLTLTQAILASGGVTRAAGSKIKVSRQGTDGRLLLSEYSLRQIEEGKLADPLLQAGDRIAVTEGR